MAERHGHLMRVRFQADADLNLKTQDAVIRNLQVIGDAAKRVSEDTRDREPAVPWRNMTGLRDRVVLDYFGVSLAIVWDVVTNHRPPLREQVRAMLRKS